MIEDLDKWEVRIVDHGYGVYRQSDNVPYGTFIQREHAVLFSAASDLLAACEFLIECSELNHWALMADEEIELVEMAEKAVKKARGES